MDLIVLFTQQFLLFKQHNIYFHNNFFTYTYFHNTYTMLLEQHYYREIEFVGSVFKKNEREKLNIIIFFFVERS